MSVLPDAGSELPADSDRAVVVCMAPMDEAVDYALDGVGLHIGVGLHQDYMSTDVHGDDRFHLG